MLGAIVLLLLGSSIATAADWPQWLGPRRDGGTSEKIEPWTDAPKIAWTVKAGVGFSSPVVVNDRVFVHARINFKEQEEMIAIDANSGKVLWRTPYDRAPYSSVLNTGPQATPAVAGGKIYGFGITGSLVCFDTETGKLDWHVDALKKLNVTVPRFGVCCSPLVLGNRVIVAVGGKGSAVVAFDTKTGEVAWQGLDEAANTSSLVLYAVKGKPIPDAVFIAMPKTGTGFQGTRDFHLAQFQAIAGSKPAAKAAFEDDPAAQAPAGLFDRIDANADGALDGAELLRASRDTSIAEAIPASFRLSAARGTRSATFGPVPIGSGSKAKPPAAPAAKRGPRWFVAMDRNGDGYVSAAEFLGPPSRFTLWDLDGDGRLSAAEADAADKK